MHPGPNGTYSSTMAGWQPHSWPYDPPPSPYHVHNRAVIPPKALPWYYTCEPLYLLGWLALRVLPIWCAIGVLIRLLGVLGDG